MEESNKFIGLKASEVEQFKLPKGLGNNFKKLTPGSKAEAGYYVEVDVDNEATDNYIHNRSQLPPTTKKGHRWVRISTRKIQS